MPTLITDALGKDKTLSYDPLAQLTQFTDCAGKSTQFTYTDKGQVYEIIDALGQITRHHIMKVSTNLFGPITLLPVKTFTNMTH